MDESQSPHEYWSASSSATDKHIVATRSLLSNSSNDITNDASVYAEAVVFELSESDLWFWARYKLANM